LQNWGFKMGYVAKSISSAGVTKALSDNLPIIQINDTNQIKETTEMDIIQKTIDVTDIDYLYVGFTSTSDAGGTDHIKLYLDAVELKHWENAGTTVSETFDLTAYTGDMTLKFSAWNTTSGKYMRLVDLIVINCNTAFHT